VRGRDVRAGAPGPRRLGVAVSEVGGSPVAVSASTDQSLLVWDLRTLTPIGRPRIESLRRFGLTLL
jgi:hypothetical protein